MPGGTSLIPQQSPAPECAAKGLSPGWRLGDSTVAACCPLGEAGDLCAHVHTRADPCSRLCWHLAVADPAGLPPNNALRIAVGFLPTSNQDVEDALKFTQLLASFFRARVLFFPRSLDIP